MKKFKGSFLTSTYNSFNTLGATFHLSNNSTLRCLMKDPPLPMIIPAVLLGTITFIWRSRSAAILLSKSIAGFALGSGFSWWKIVSLINTRVGPDTFFAGYRISGWFLMQDIRYPISYQCLISGKLSDIQPYIRYPDCFNIRYPAEYWKLPDIRFGRISGPTLFPTIIPLMSL